MWKNANGEVSQLRPNRVRLPNSETRTAEEVTDEVLAEAGWYWEEPVVIVAPPVVDPETITITEEFIEPQESLFEPVELLNNVTITTNLSQQIG